jgi:DNA (cytosine-5)-methyltransferase 1
MSKSTKPYVAIDLFAGGGGLTVGLKKAGFLVSAAVEIDAEAAKTYQANHTGTVLFQQDIRSITGDQLKRTSPTNLIDLISACPPCQGFSSLTSKYKKVDPRNELIFEFVRLVKEIEPSIIMMENVPGLAQKGAPLFQKALNTFRELGYDFSYKVLDVADFGVPQRRSRLVLLGSKKSNIIIPAPSHSAAGENGKKLWTTVRSALSAEKLGPTLTLKKALAKNGPKSRNWHIVRDLSTENKERLKAIKAGQSRKAIPNHLRPKCHQGTETGFSNVYGRMSWDKPAPTITGGCTTLSKGRFGHPDKMRTISVREAALLQTFPADYIFDTDSMENACKIIGNALPPIFAEAMAKVCFDSLTKSTNHNL